MERDHEFTINLSGAGTYVIKLLEGVQIEQADGTTIGRWPAFDLEAKGDSEAEVNQQLLGSLQQQIGKPGSPEFEPFAAYVREHGTVLSDEEAATRELARLRAIPIRWRVTDVLAQEAKDKQAYVVARDKLTAITPDDITDESSTGVPLLVDFWAEWCGPCRMVTPVLAELAEQWAGRIVVRKIDVDKFDGIWERFNFRGIPAMLMFKDGQEIHRVIGFGGKAKLVAELEPHLA
jgi:thioredoxin